MSVIESEVQGATEEEVWQLPVDAVDRDVQIDVALERLSELEAEKERNEEIAQKRMDPIQLWLAAENERLEAEASFYRERIKALARDYDYGKKKSRNLAHGTFGTRKVGGGLEIVDADVVLAFAKKHGIPTKETVGKSALNEWRESTGLVPEGCEAVPETREFYVKPAKGGEA